MIGTIYNISDYEGEINLKFPYAKPTKFCLDDYFREIQRKKFRSKS